MTSQNESLKRLTGRRLQIASGLTDLPINKVEQYRARFAAQGYALPEIVNPDAIPRRRPKQKMPSLRRRAWNFTKAVASFAGDGFKKVHPKVYERRMEVCDGCVYRQENACLKCGCNLTAKAKWNSQQCPIGKWSGLSDEPDPRPFPGEPIRDLFYHVYPVNGPAWKWNSDRLLERLHIFNGTKVLGIAHDRSCVDVDEVVRHFPEGTWDKVIVVENQKKRAETQTFIPAMKFFKTDDENRILCVTHAKGVKRPHFGPDTRDTAIYRWTQAMWDTVVSNWQEAEQALAKGYGCAGSFKRYGSYRSGHQWHYSGTFFWVRSAMVWNEDRRNSEQDVDRAYYGMEAWPGKVFREHESYCLFHDNAGHLYDIEPWERVVHPQLMRWHRSRGHLSDTVLLVGKGPSAVEAKELLEEHPDWDVAVISGAGLHIPEHKPIHYCFFSDIERARESADMSGRAERFICPSFLHKEFKKSESTYRDAGIPGKKVWQWPYELVNVDEFEGAVSSGRIAHATSATAAHHWLAAREGYSRIVVTGCDGTPGYAPGSSGVFSEERMADSLAGFRRAHNKIAEECDKQLGVKTIWKC